MRRTATTAALLAATLIAGCGGEDGGKRSAAAPSPTAAASRAKPTPTPTPTAAPRDLGMRFASADGKRLRGRLTPARSDGAPAVVLVHEYQGGPRQWNPLIGDLHKAGFATLAYASRSAYELDETILARDVEGAVAALRERPEVDPERIVLAGASIGGTTVAYVLGTRPDVQVLGGVGLSAVEISPGTAGRFQPHDLLLIADDRELLNARNLREDAGGKGITLFNAPVDGHGVVLLSDERVRAKVVGWLRQLVA